MVKLQKQFTTLQHNSEILDYSMPVIALFAASQTLDMFSLVAIILSEIAPLSKGEDYSKIFTARPNSSHGVDFIINNSAYFKKLQMLLLYQKEKKFIHKQIHLS